MFVRSWHKLQHFPTTVLVGLRTQATLSPGDNAVQPAHGGGER